MWDPKYFEVQRKPDKISTFSRVFPETAWTLDSEGISGDTSVVLLVYVGHDIHRYMDTPPPMLLWYECYYVT